MVWCGVWCGVVCGVVCGVCLCHQIVSWYRNEWVRMLYQDGYLNVVSVSPWKLVHTAQFLLDTPTDVVQPTNCACLLRGGTWPVCANDKVMEIASVDSLSDETVPTVIAHCQFALLKMRFSLLHRG